MSHRVMIVDDSLTVRMDLAEAFREGGFDPVPCAGVAEATAALRAELPALIVLDVVLPDEHGLEFLTRLRATPTTATIPVILLSGAAEIPDRIQGFNRGASHYVGKPYDRAYVVARALEVLRERDADVPASALILVIDDSRTYREALTASLHEAGYRTAQASSAKEGLRKAADLHPEAVIVDGVMPNMDGTALIRQVRLDPGLNATPCLLLTASEEAASEVDALDSGADAYVRKTESMDVILARLGAVLRAATDSRERASSSSAMGPKRVLAVDDSPTYLAEVSERLQAEGYEVIRASSGADALDLLSVERVDCILLDFLMPGLSGPETCTRIKSVAELGTIPLIMLTSLDEPDAIIAGMNAGADDYVTKTVDFEVIMARLRAQLRRKQLEDENRSVQARILRKEAEAQAAREQADARAALLEELEHKNRELEALNRELQMFAYSVSHDLRQPLRSMDGFSKVLLDVYGPKFDDKGRHYLERVRAGAQRMGQLIDGLLMLSRVTRKTLSSVPVRLDEIAHRVIERLRDAHPGRNLEVVIAEPMEAMGDAQLLETALENLLGNAWKFTSQQSSGRIEVAMVPDPACPTYLVRDNGVGFKMDYADKLFSPFARLHSESAFPGTGIGLATVQRIVHRHGGTIWTEAEPDHGATFFFTLGGRTGGPD